MSGVRRQQGRLREDSGLSLSPADAVTVLRLAREAGFSRAGFVDPDALGSRDEPTAAWPADDGMEWSWVSAPNAWKDKACILVCCLSCHRAEPDDLSTTGDPHGLIAPFARRNYYRTAARMMHRLLVRLDEEMGIARAESRIFCNSRLPEKPLCVAAGLAFLATNALCIAPGLGSLFVIAGAVIPRPLSLPASPGAPQARNRCGTCRRCIDACPTAAIVSPGVVDRGRCIAGLASHPGALASEVMEAWGARVYGCQECQSVCPHNRGPLEEGPDASGGIGPSIPLSRLLSLGARGLEELFHGTAMGLSWVSREAIVRNAIVAAGNRGASALRKLIAPYADSGSQTLEAAARWAMRKLEKETS